MRIEDNTFQNIYVDLTYKCNMNCSNCYNPDRSDYEMDLAYFEDVCKRLPNKVNFKFLGGEPALHSKFFDFIITAKNHGHTAFFATNGMILNDESFVKELKTVQISYPFTLSLTLDGGLTGRQVYQDMNGHDCYMQKMIALKNLIAKDIKRVALTSIIVRGLNEHVISELTGVAKSFKNIRYLHFRTLAPIGRWMHIEPYTMTELKTLVGESFTEGEMAPKCFGEISCPPDTNSCCYRFRPTKRLQVSLIEFATEQAQNCQKRGKLLENYEIVPWFKNMAEHSIV